MRAILPLDPAVIHQLEVGLIHQSRGLQSMAEPLPGHVMGGEVWQLPHRCAAALFSKGRTRALTGQRALHLRHRTGWRLGKTHPLQNRNGFESGEPTCYKTGTVLSLASQPATKPERF